MTTTPERTATLTALVAAEIRAMMGRLDVRQSELARRLGENDQWLSVRLKARTPIDVNDLQRIARALGVGVHELLPSPEVAEQAAAPAKAEPAISRKRTDKTSSRSVSRPERRHPQPGTPRSPMIPQRIDPVRPVSAVPGRSRRPRPVRPGERRIAR